MVPSEFIFVNQVPRTSSDKIDRTALPELVAKCRSRLLEQSRQPLTEWEGRIVAIWKRLLVCEAIDIDDNFFDLGGHSLLIIKVHAELTETYDCELSVVALFRFPTVRSLASLLSQNDSK